MAEKRRVGTIDLTPSWRGVMPILIATLKDGTSEGQKMAEEELFKLADWADAAMKDLPA